MPTPPTCPLCGQACTSGPRMKDSRDRVYHQPCYEEAKRQQAAKRVQPETFATPTSATFKPLPAPNSKQTAAKPSAAKLTATKPSAGKPIPAPPATTFNVGDRVGCSNGDCGAKFVIPNERAATANNLACPKCRSPLVQLPNPAGNAPVVSTPPATIATPVSETPTVAAAPNLGDLLDEVMPSNEVSADRAHVLKLLSVQDSGLLNAEYEAELRSLLAACRARDRYTCPKCTAATQYNAVLCVACGLHFESGKSLMTNSPASHPLTAQSEKEMAAREKLAMAQLALDARRHEDISPSESGGGGGAVAADVALTLIQIFGGM